MTRTNVYLRARPGKVAGTAPAGLHTLVTPPGMRKAVCYVSRQYVPSQPAPLVLLLHGAGGDAQNGLQIMQHLADENGLILVAAASASYTWDVIVSGAIGPDVAVIDHCLQQVFERYAVDCTRLAISGFSDGASYALSLGLPNGDLFSHVLAFSPGFLVPTMSRGKPSIFISHGTGDTVLPIARCSRRIVPGLKRYGYPVTYQEFEGGHVIPPALAQEALAWWLK